MLIKRETYGFTVKVDRRGKAPVRLTFEEVYTRNSLRRKYCCIVDVGIYRKYGNGLAFKEMGSFEIKDWFKLDSELKKRARLKRLLGVTVYDELTNSMIALVRGSYMQEDRKRVGAI